MASFKSQGLDRLPGAAVVGNIMVDPDRTEFYVPIPKVGTNSLRATLPDWRSEDTRLGIPDLPCWAFIRHPVDRWFSGLMEDTFHHGQERTWDNMLEEARNGRFEWSNHTRAQYEFVSDFLDEVELVKFDNASAFIQERYGRKLAWERHRFWDRVPDLEGPITEHYAEDFKLYEVAA